jgi:hypothetical protein
LVGDKSKIGKEGQQGEYLETLWQDLYKPIAYKREKY